MNKNNEENQSLPAEAGGKNTLHAWKSGAHSGIAVGAGLACVGGALFAVSRAKRSASEAAASADGKEVNACGTSKKLAVAAERFAKGGLAVALAAASVAAGTSLLESMKTKHDNGPSSDN
jgi:hypothetical protein